MRALPKKQIPRILLAALLGMRLAGAAPVTVDPSDKIVLEKFLEHAQGEVDSLTKEHFDQLKIPEKLCWIDFPKLNMALTAYEMTGEIKYLRSFAKAFENLRATLRRGPDGFLGWNGEPESSLQDPAKPGAVISEIQTDFRAVAVISRFVEIIQKEPSLRKEFGSLRQTGVDLMKNHLVRKWDTSYMDLGDQGGTYQWNAEYKPAMANLCLPYEKLSIMVEGLLGLYRVTGTDEYMRKAIKLGTWFKRGLELQGDHYAWNRWNPAGNWEVNPEDPKKWKSWIGKEPKPEWYASSVSSAVLLYQHGVVFDRTDVDRFVKTQTEVCWQGGMENPKFFQVDGKEAKDNAHFIAPALAPFDQRIADLLYRGSSQAVRVSKSGDPWHGGVLAGDWLRGKYLNSAQTTGGRAPYQESGAKFLRKKENAEFAKSLQVEVTPPGHRTPPAPPSAALELESKKPGVSP